MEPPTTHAPSWISITFPPKILEGSLQCSEPLESESVCFCQPRQKIHCVIEEGANLNFFPDSKFIPRQDEFVEFILMI